MNLMVQGLSYYPVSGLQEPPAVWLKNKLFFFHRTLGDRYNWARTGAFKLSACYKVKLVLERLLQK